MLCEFCVVGQSGGAGGQLDLEKLFQVAISKHRQGRLLEAKAIYERILVQQPVHVGAQHFLGVVAYQLGHLSQSVQLISRAIRTDPREPAAYVNLGNALNGLRRLDEALSNYDKAIALKPDHAEAYNNRGNVLKELRRLDEALASYDKALALKPDYAGAFINRSSTLLKLNRGEEALSSYQMGIRLKPALGDSGLGLLHLKSKLCDWTDRSQAVKAITNGVKRGEDVFDPFILLSIIESQELLLKAAKSYAAKKAATKPAFYTSNRRARSQKITLGYFSPEFRNHATSALLAELIELHDRKQFEVKAFSFGPATHDEMHSRMLSTFDKFQDLRDLSDEAIAKSARDEGVDIVVDLAGFTPENRAGIFSWRAAPIQVNYLGCAGSMGSEYHDYIIGDRILIPPANQAFFTEKIVYLPHTYQPNDRKRQSSERIFSRVEFGLPDNAFVYCCFNQTYKITPQVFDTWMRILCEVDGSILWLLKNSDCAAHNLQQEAARRGIDSSRLVFAPKMPLKDHLARHRLADLFLDTLPCNAHTTASEALWMGMPVLTQIGEAFAGRVAASVLNAIGLPELIKTSTEDYQAAAVELARNPPKLQAIKEKLAHNRLITPLFD